MSDAEAKLRLDYARRELGIQQTQYRRMLAAGDAESPASLDVQLLTVLAAELKVKLLELPLPVE